MSYGYMGKILWVDLTNGTTREEVIDDEVYKHFLTGYGLAAKVIFDNQKPGVDPLGPENIFSVMSGLLTGSDTWFTGRWMVAAKSPLTGTWGDANCGGHFAPAIKETGYDGFFFTGKSPNPVYLLIDGDQKELLDASGLWGLDSNNTEDTLKNRHGQNFQVACIGIGGEKLSLMAGVVTDKGRLAARSGLGAVMGSKNLKAICLKGNKTIEFHDVDTIANLSRDFIKKFNKYKYGLLDRILGWLSNVPFFSSDIRWLSEHKMMPQTSDLNRYVMKTWGTSGIVANSANTGDSPIKNWKGVGCIDFPAMRTQKISNDSVTKYEFKKYGCYRCPLICGGILTVRGGKYPLLETHKPEYETICGFGSMLLSNDITSIIKMNDLLNRAGIDTISCAVTVAWAFEAYENKIITEQDTGGLKLEWGNSEAVVELVRKIIDAEGIGKHLKDGVKKASEHFGFSSEKFAMHVNGQELPMHDPRAQDSIGLGVAYEAEPTPGRHTSSLEVPKEYWQDNPKTKSNSKPKRQQKRKFIHTMRMKSADGQDRNQLRDDSCFMDLINGFGLCAFGFDVGVTLPIIKWANAATGWNKSFDDYLWIARRIKTVRHSFNVREGLDPSKIRMPDRARGIPPLKKGPNANSTPNFDTPKQEYYKAMGYNPDTTKPLPETLDMLGLPEVKKALYGE